MPGNFSAADDYFRKDQQIKDLRRELDAIIFRRNKTNNKIPLKTVEKSTQTDVNRKERSRERPKVLDIRSESNSRSSRRHSPETSSKNKEKERSSSHEKHKSSSDERHKTSSYRKDSSRHVHDDRYRNHQSEKSKDIKSDKPRKRLRSRSSDRRGVKIDGHEKHQRPNDSNPKGRRKEPDLREVLLKKKTSKIDEVKRPTKLRRESPRKVKTNNKNLNSAEILSIKSSDSEIEIISVSKIDTKKESGATPMPVLDESLGESIKPLMEQPINIEEPESKEEISDTGIENISTQVSAIFNEPDDSQINLQTESTSKEAPLFVDPSIEAEQKLPINSQSPTELLVSELLVDILPELNADQGSQTTSSPSPPSPFQSPIKTLVESNLIDPSNEEILNEKIDENNLSAFNEPLSLALLTNDSLDSSGRSKENSLNQSQENGNIFKTKRSSYQKDVNEDGIVVFTITRHKGKKKKKKKES